MKLLIVILLLFTSCSTIYKIVDVVEDYLKEDKAEFVNPDIPPSSGGREQEWYWAWKEYDGTFRIRWPSYFHNEHQVGDGSYTTINGERADFRGIWRDDGVSQRPSYTIPGPRSRFEGIVLVQLYAANDKLLAWFRIDAGSTQRGYLPPGSP